MDEKLRSERLFILAFARMNTLDRRDELQEKIVRLYERIAKRPKKYHAEIQLEIEAFENVLKETVNRIQLIEDWQKEVEGA